MSHDRSKYPCEDSLNPRFKLFKPLRHTSAHRLNKTVCLQIPAGSTIRLRTSTPTATWSSPSVMAMRLRAPQAVLPSVSSLMLRRSTLLLWCVLPWFVAVSFPNVFPYTRVGQRPWLEGLPPVSLSQQMRRMVTKDQVRVEILSSRQRSSMRLMKTEKKLASASN